MLIRESQAIGNPQEKSKKEKSKSVRKVEDSLSAVCRTVSRLKNNFRMSAYNSSFATPRNTQSVGNIGGSSDLEKILNLNSVSPSPAARPPNVTQQSPSDTNNNNNGRDSVVETPSEHSDPTTNQKGGESYASQFHFSADGNNGNGYHHLRYGSSGGYYNNNLYFNHHHSPYHRPYHIPSSTNLGYSPMSQASSGGGVFNRNNGGGSPSGSNFHSVFGRHLQSSPSSSPVYGYSGRYGGGGGHVVQRYSSGYGTPTTHGGSFGGGINNNGGAGKKPTIMMQHAAADYGNAGVLDVDSIFNRSSLNAENGNGRNGGGIMKEQGIVSPINDNGNDARLIVGGSLTKNENDGGMDSPVGSIARRSPPKSDVSNLGGPLAIGGGIPVLRNGSYNPHTTPPPNQPPIGLPPMPSLHHRGYRSSTFSNVDPALMQQEPSSSLEVDRIFVTILIPEPGECGAGRMSSRENVEPENVKPENVEPENVEPGECGAVPSWSSNIDRGGLPNSKGTESLHQAGINPYMLDHRARFFRSATENIHPSYMMQGPSRTWSGSLPGRNYDNPMYSRKIFIGGLPWEVSEGVLLSGFTEFGTCQVEWPGKKPRHKCSPIKYTPRGCGNGYVYIIYEQEEYVRALLEKCSQDYGCVGDPSYKLNAKHSRTQEICQVQVIPWAIGDSNYVLAATARLDPKKTVFIGALHGMVTAEILAKIMNDLFDSVVYAGVDTDKFKYPIGSGRVTFSRSESYYAAINAAFVEIKTTKFKKKVQIDPFLEDEICSVCNKVLGPYFCRQMICFNYFCRACWQNTHCNLEVFRHHKPLMRKSRRNIDNSVAEEESQDRQETADHVGGSPGSRAGHGRSPHARRRLIDNPLSPNVPGGSNGSNGDDGGPEGDVETVESQR